MLREFFQAFMLGFGRKVWVIESQLGGTDQMWDTLGTVMGVRDPESAIAMARSTWPDLYPDVSINLRAVAWSEANADQRNAAAYEDNLRENEVRLRRNERDTVSQLRAMSEAMHQQSGTDATTPDDERDAASRD